MAAGLAAQKPWPWTATAWRFVSPGFTVRRQAHPLLDPGMKLIQKLPDADAVRRWAKERKLPEFKTPFATLWARMQRDKRKKNNTKGGKHA